MCAFDRSEDFDPLSPRWPVSLAGKPQIRPFAPGPSQIPGRNDSRARCGHPAPTAAGNLSEVYPQCIPEGGHATPGILKSKIVM